MAASPIISYISRMIESPDDDGPGKTYRTKGALRPAQHRFLMLGIIVIAVIAAILVVLNQSVKEETKLQTGLAYDAVPPTSEPAIAPQEPAVTPDNPNPPADVSGAPTTEVPPSE